MSAPKVARVSKKAPAAQSGFISKTRLTPFKRSSISYGYKEPISIGPLSKGLLRGKTQIAAQKALKQIYGKKGAYNTEKVIFKQKAYTDAINKIRQKQEALSEGALKTGFFKSSRFGSVGRLRRKMTAAVAGQKKYNAKSQKMIASLQSQGLVEKTIPGAPLAEGMKQKSLSNVIGSLKAKREAKATDVSDKTKQLQTIVAQKQGLFNAYSAATRAVDQAKNFGVFPKTATGQNISLATLEAKLKVARDASKKFSAESAPAIRVLARELKAVKKVNSISTNNLYKVARNLPGSSAITKTAKAASFRQTLNVRQAKRNAKFSTSLTPTFFAKSRGIQAWASGPQQEKLAGYITAAQNIRTNLASNPNFIPTPEEQKTLKREMKALSVLGALGATGVKMSAAVSGNPAIQKLLKAKATQSATNKAAFQAAPVDLTGFKTRTQEFTQGLKKGAKAVGSVLSTMGQLALGRTLTLSGTKKKVAPVVTDPVPLFEKVKPVAPVAPISGPAAPKTPKLKGVVSALTSAAQTAAQTATQTASSFVAKGKAALGLGGPAAASINAAGTAGAAPAEGVAAVPKEKKPLINSAKKTTETIFRALTGTTPEGAKTPTRITGAVVGAIGKVRQGVSNFLAPVADPGVLKTDAPVDPGVLKTVTEAEKVPSFTNPNQGQPEAAPKTPKPADYLTVEAAAPPKKNAGQYMEVSAATEPIYATVSP